MTKKKRPHLAAQEDGVPHLPRVRSACVVEPTVCVGGVMVSHYASFFFFFIQFEIALQFLLHYESSLVSKMVHQASEGPFSILLPVEQTVVESKSRKYASLAGRPSHRFSVPEPCPEGVL